MSKRETLPKLLKEWILGACVQLGCKGCIREHWREKHIQCIPLVHNEAGNECCLTRICLMH